MYILPCPVLPCVALGCVLFSKACFLFFGVWEFGGLEILGVCLFVVFCYAKGKRERRMKYRVGGMCVCGYILLPVLYLL